MTTKIETIIALFEKSKNSASSEAEKKSSIEMAKKLMEKHNITEEDLDKNISKSHSIVIWSFTVSPRVINSEFFGRILLLASKHNIDFNHTTCEFKCENKEKIKVICDLHNTTLSALLSMDGINNRTNTNKTKKKKSFFKSIFEFWG